jgi:hypothetical protein
MVDTVTFVTDIVNYSVYQLYDLQGELPGYQDMKRVVLNTLRTYEYDVFMKKIVKASLANSIHKGKFLGFMIDKLLVPTINLQDEALRNREIKLRIEHEDVSLEVLRSIVETKKAELLSYNGVRTPQLDNRLAQDLAWSSDAIEGTTVEKDESRSLLRQGREPPVGEDKIELTNHFETIVTEVFPMTNRSLQDVNEAYMMRLHKGLDIVRMDATNKGQYRRKNVTIRDRPNPEFADYQDIPRLCREMFEKLHTMEEKDPIYVAGWLHFQFEQISPFLNGNGPAGRMLMNTVLIQEGFPLACIQPSVKDIYLYSLLGGCCNERLSHDKRRSNNEARNPCDLLIRIITESLVRSLDIGLYYVKQKLQLENPRG